MIHCSLENVFLVMLSTTQTRTQYSIQLLRCSPRTCPWLSNMWEQTHLHQILQNYSLTDYWTGLIAKSLWHWIPFIITHFLSYRQNNKFRLSAKPQGKFHVGFIYVVLSVYAILHFSGTCWWGGARNCFFDKYIQPCVFRFLHNYATTIMFLFTCTVCIVLTLN